MSEIEQRKMRLFVALVRAAARAVKHAHSELPSGRLPVDAADAIFELHEEFLFFDRSLNASREVSS